MVEPSVRKLLLAEGPLNGIIADRAYLGEAPQDERRPRVVLTLLSKVYPHTHDGGAGYQTGRIQLACLAPTYQAAHELADAVRKCIDLYEGPGAAEGVEVMHCECESADDIAREPYEGTGTGTFGVALVCRFMLNETI